MNVFDMPFSKVYACLVQKAERKGRTKDEVDRIIIWLTGYSTVEAISNVSYGAFIDGAPEWNPRAEFITGKVCGIQVETIADPRMKKLRQLDKLVDELAKGCGRPGFDPWVGKIPRSREKLPTPVFWPGEFHGLYSPWGCKESDTNERLSLSSC